MSESGQELSNDDHVSLSRLVTELVWRIDHGGAGTAWELFTQDGEMALGPQVMVGHDALRAWAAARGGIDRQTKHVCTNMRFTPAGPDRAEGTTILTVYLHDGPGSGLSVAHTVGEYHDTFVREGGTWRFRSRNTVPQFSAPAQ